MVQVGEYIRVPCGKKGRYWFGEVTRCLPTGSVDARYWRGSWLDWEHQELRAARVPARAIRVVKPLEWETYTPQLFLNLQVVSYRAGYGAHISSGHAQHHLFEIPTADEAKQRAVAEASRILKELAGGAYQQLEEWSHFASPYREGVEWWCGYMAQKWMQVRIYRTRANDYHLEVYAYKQLYGIGLLPSLEEAQGLGVQLARESLANQAKCIDAFEPSWRLVRAY